MGIVGDDAITVADTANDIKTKSIYNNTFDTNNIVPHIDGPRWDVDYFNKSSVPLDTVNGQDTDLPAGVDKFQLIRDTVIHVTTAIENTTPDAVTGEGILQNGIAPIVGDRFKATLLGNRDALFTVSEVNKRSYKKNDLYDISYKLTVFLDDDEGMLEYNNLKSKVIADNTMVSPENVDNGSIILTTEFNNLSRLKSASEDITEDLSNFLYYQNNSRLILVPDQSQLIADIHMENFVYSLLNISDTNLGKMNRLVTSGRLVTETTILDILRDRIPGRLSSLPLNVGMRHTTVSTDVGDLRSMALLGITGMLKIEAGLTNTLKIDTVTEVSTKIPPLTFDSYILPARFYSNTDANNWTDLEKLLRGYLNKEVLSPTTLLGLVNDTHNWTPLEKFYYMPLLLLLLKSTVNQFYKG